MIRQSHRPWIPTMIRISACVGIAPFIALAAWTLWHASRCTGPLPTDRCPLAGSVSFKSVRPELEPLDRPILRPIQESYGMQCDATYTGEIKWCDGAFRCTTVARCLGGMLQLES
jgi:hypothetical protein